MSHKYIVSGSLVLSPSGNATVGTVAKERGLEYLPLVDLPLAEVQRRLRELPSDSAVVFGGYWKDEAGRVRVPADVLESLCRESPVPFFGISDTYVGRGIVGGIFAVLWYFAVRNGSRVDRLRAAYAAENKS